MAKARAHLLLCDNCCDQAGAVKEMLKTGGCTCDICGWSCQCSGDDCKQYVNRVLVGCIPDEGWDWLARANARSLTPLDWERLFEER